MSWDLDNGTSNTDKAEFTKFDEGVTVIRLAEDNPSVRWTHWMPIPRRSATCPGKGCPICDIRNVQKANNEPLSYNVARRFALQILNRSTGKLEIMEQGITFFEDLKDVRAMIHEKGKDILDVDIAVRRRGTGKDNTSYRLDPEKEYKYTEEDIKMLEKTVDLNEYFTPHTPEQLTRVINGEDWNEVMYPKNEESKEEATDNSEDFQLK